MNAYNTHCFLSWRREKSLGFCRKMEERTFSLDLSCEESGGGGWGCDFVVDDRAGEETLSNEAPTIVLIAGDKVNVTTGGSGIREVRIQSDLSMFPVVDGVAKPTSVRFSVLRRDRLRDRRDRVDGPAIQGRS